MNQIANATPLNPPWIGEVIGFAIQRDVHNNMEMKAGKGPHAAKQPNQRRQQDTISKSTR